MSRSGKAVEDERLGKDWFGLVGGGCGQDRCKGFGWRVQAVGKARCLAARLGLVRRLW